MQTLEKATTPQMRQPLTVKIAVWSARHKWLVFGLWFVSTIGLFAVGQVMGTRVRQLNSEADIYTTLEAGKGWQIYNQDGNEPAPQLFIVVVSHPKLTATEPIFKEKVSDLTTSLKSLTLSEDGQQKPLFSQMADFYTFKLPILVSKDNSSTRIIATVAGKADQQTKNLAPAEEIIKKFRAANPEFTIHYLNQALLLDELVKVVQKDMDNSVLITMPVTFVILLVAFGAVVAAFVPLVLAVTALQAAFGLLAIYSQLISPIDFSSAQLVGLIGLAVGIDYSLFMIKRYRSERHKGRDKLTAIEIASSTAGRAVFFSGGVVMISLSGLFLMNDASFNAVAIGTIGVVLISVIGSLTFLPATLAILGNGVNWGRIPYFGSEREEGSSLWAKLVGFVIARPVICTTLTILILLAVGSPFLRLKLGSDAAAGAPNSMEGQKAINLLNQKWPEGTLMTLDVFVTAADQPQVKAALAKFEQAGLQLPGLSGPTKVTTSKGGKVSYLTFYMAGGRTDETNRNLVLKVRKELVPLYFGNLKETQVYISGDPAFAVDIVNLYAEKTPLVVGFVLTLSFILLLVAFRSLLIPVKAILLNFLSLSASYGALVLIFQDGWLAKELNFTPTGQIEAFIPLFMFTILFGLSMDYHLLILTRIKEARDGGMTTSAAVAKGISVTSATITSAAAIMVVVFAVFITLSLLTVKQLGVGMSLAIFVDATIIRSILLPATMRLLGEWNWWLPSFLNWLPHVTIEGHTDQD